MVVLEQHSELRQSHLILRTKPTLLNASCPNTIELIATVNETQEDHARKSIQMQALADNFALQIASKVEKDGNKNVYGKCFRYVDAFLGKIMSTNEIVTIEQFAYGTFQRNKDTEKQGKAESLVHFSLVKSNKKGDMI